eukprot:CAMPEP_0204433968 /NCGR_PEP_ID=MMETSP0470-20130426/70620_1 /ASSEMBLY_ACC=CAM_ASM_000385 /TAXON_ID=2969 /ORGANISM="Oxyrrhis marina" /LENGTH=86 /DNA_ID=CAMNT_0051432419 /DNA_START=43 /DNA_END=299 /DNA_ORIENTATION=-
MGRLMKRMTVLVLLLAVGLAIMGCSTTRGVRDDRRRGDSKEAGRSGSNETASGGHGDDHSSGRSRGGWGGSSAREGAMEPGSGDGG